MNPERRYPWTISTIGDLIDMGYSLSAWCQRHGMRSVDLQVLADRYGRHETINRQRTRICIKCGVCGNRLEEWVCSESSKPTGVHY